MNMKLDLVFKATGKKQHAAEINEAVNEVDFFCLHERENQVVDVVLVVAISSW